MAKKKSQERGKVKLGLRDLSNETYKLVQRLDDVVSDWGNMMSIKDLSEIVDAVKTECGDDANVAVKIDDYFGNSVDIDWYRPETDEEWVKRVEKNRNIAVGAQKKRAADKMQKIVDEKAELARLQEKYPEED